MVDTVALAQNLPFTPSERHLESLGWQVKFDQITGRRMWFYREDRRCSPYISLFRSRIGQVYIVVNVSLPAFFRGTNARLLEDGEVTLALSQLSDYVSERTGVAFDASTALVWKVHFAKDYRVGEDMIRPMISKLSCIKIPYFAAASYGETTAYHHSRGSAKENGKARTICFYGKYEDAIVKKFGTDDLAFTKGNLRLELRHNDSRTVKRLCDKLGIVNQFAQSIFVEAVSATALETLDIEIQSAMRSPGIIDRIYTLIERVGPRKARALLSFLVLRDSFGTNFFTNPRLGYSRSLYFSSERELRRANIWSLTDTQEDDVGVNSPE